MEQQEKDRNKPVIIFYILSVFFLVFSIIFFIIPSVEGGLGALFLAVILFLNAKKNAKQNT